MNLKERLEGCLLCGAIGDAVGGWYEGNPFNETVSFDHEWSLSDDTQLTLATCEALLQEESFHPQKVANRFRNWFFRGELTGLGASTFKALQRLQRGTHWTMAGNSGEYAAGNGAAMRIAPLAFKSGLEKQTIRDVCCITHRNEEAYVGALAIYLSIQSVIREYWTGDQNLIEIVTDQLPPSKVRNRLIDINQYKNVSITDLRANYRATGYVVDSVPIAIFAAQKINEQDLPSLFRQLIEIGGDTDTTCSMAGQIIGALKGIAIIPNYWLEKARKLDLYPLIEKIVSEWE